jgi:hypothetical protein
VFEMSKAFAWLVLFSLVVAGCPQMTNQTYEDVPTAEIRVDVASEHAMPSDGSDASSDAVVDAVADTVNDLVDSPPPRDVVDVVDASDVRDVVDTIDIVDTTDVPASDVPMGDSGCRALDGALCPVVANADATCAGGVCGFSCHSGFADCDSNASNGCEVNLQSDPAHCGVCTTMCPLRMNAVAVCTAGTCGYTCNAGYADCNGVAGDGCEIPTNTDPNNCGVCGTACTGALNAPPTCIGGSCIFTCASGWADCNMIHSDGCEINVNTNPNHCRTCTNVCTSVPNASPTCMGGACGIVCTTGYADCNSDLSDGCETSIATSVTNCGSCMHACTAGPQVMSMACVASACAVATCNPGYADCNHAAFDGCEVSVALDMNNCGICGHICTAPNATSSCSSGVCSIMGCGTGFRDCDGAYANGCEAYLATDPNNCGTCGNVCPSATPRCAGGLCGP